MALNIRDRFLRIQPAGQNQRIAFQNLLSERRRILSHGKRMLVHDAVNAVIVVLKRVPIAQRADIVAKRRHTRGLNPAEYNLFSLCLLFHCLLLPYCHEIHAQPICFARPPKISTPLTSCSSVGVEKFRRKHCVLSVSFGINAVPGTTATLFLTAFQAKGRHIYAIRQTAPDKQTALRLVKRDAA